MEPNGEQPEILKNVPLIPLRDLVVFPATLVPFIIGRASSIQALEKAAETDKLIVLAAQMDASLDNPEPKDIYSLGVTAKIIRTVPMDDKNVKVIVEGKRRARILEFLQLAIPSTRSWPRRSGSSKTPARTAQEELKRALALFEEYLKLSQNTNFQSIIPALRDHTPDRIADIIASHLYLPLDEKQNLLETINSLERIRRLNFLLENEIFQMPGQPPRKDGKPLGRREAPVRSAQGGPDIFTPGGGARGRRRTSRPRDRGAEEEGGRGQDASRRRGEGHARRSSGWRPCRRCRPRPRSAATISTG